VSIPAGIGVLVLEALYVARFLTLLPLRNHKLDALSFFERAVAVARDAGIVDKDVLLRFVNGDKTIAFGIVKPLDNTS
jgi:hypothetical protein